MSLQTVDNRSVESITLGIKLWTQLIKRIAACTRIADDGLFCQQVCASAYGADKLLTPTVAIKSHWRLWYRQPLDLPNMEKHYHARYLTGRPNTLNWHYRHWFELGESSVRGYVATMAALRHFCGCLKFLLATPVWYYDKRPCSWVGIATGYGLGGPGIESRLGEIFPHLSTPALGPTQPPVHGYRVFPRGRKRLGCDVTPHPF
jgi:hypothetical protein